MNITPKDYLLRDRLVSAGIDATLEDANTLRRASLTLHRWHELECGDGNNWASWTIERDEATNVPYMVTYPHDGKPRRARYPDKEAGALKRVREVCERLGLHYFQQGDPRGCALYVSKEPLPANNYNRGVAIY